MKALLGAIPRAAAGRAGWGRPAPGTEYQAPGIEHREAGTGHGALHVGAASLGSRRHIWFGVLWGEGEPGGFFAGMMRVRSLLALTSCVDF